MKKTAKNKECVLYVRLDADQHAYIKEQAGAAGVTVSEFMRCAACNTSVRTKADAAVLRELRRLGGLCKHGITSGADSTACGDAFKALQKYAASLVRE